MCVKESSDVTKAIISTTQGSGKTTMLKACVKVMHETNFFLKYGVKEKDLCTGKRDKEGTPLFVGDVIENDKGLRFEIRFGEFIMYCPVDDCMMENVGFFCVADGYYEDMPLGPTEQYAKKIGNIYDNPELAVAAEYRCQAESEIQENSIYEKG